MESARSKSIFNTYHTLKNVYSNWKTSPSSPTRTITTFRKHKIDSLVPLYRRISRVGDRDVSVVPILDQWIQEGGTVDKERLITFVKELRNHKRYTHALEISMWMTDKRFIELTNSDVAIRLDLIAKVHGIEEAEKFFNNTHVKLRAFQLYSALLNNYAKFKHVEKAEALMQKMKDLGLVVTTLSYNILLNLYYQTGNIEKLEALVQQMEEKGVIFDKFTYGTLLSGYAAVSNIADVERVFKNMESDPKLTQDWSLYAVAANGLRQAGLIEKALEALKKSEKLISGRKRNIAYDFLITQYATMDKKDEVLRLWERYKKNEKVFNRGYISVLTSILKFDDMENAELIFDEWESQGLTYDIRIPNYLIGSYSRKGLLEKAETLIERIISKGGKPDANTWYYLATGYLCCDEPLKGVETMKKALQVCGPRWNPDKQWMSACLKYLKEEGDVAGAEEFIELLGDKKIFTLNTHDKLLDYVRGENCDKNPLDDLKDKAVDEGEMSELLEDEKPETFDNVENQKSTQKRSVMNKEQIDTIEAALVDEPDIHRNSASIQALTDKLSSQKAEVTPQQLKNWIKNRKARLARLNKDPCVPLEIDSTVHQEEQSFG